MARKQGDVAQFDPISDERLDELIEEHNGYQQIARVGCSTLTMCEVFYALRELLSLREKAGELETRLELAERAKQELRQGYDRLREKERALREALESIMRARGNPKSPVTNMGRSMMREIAAAALAQSKET